ncbi:MAG: hypothetical protein WA957_09480 [Alteraurantiacibacter sp.]
MIAEAIQIDEPVDRPQQMIRRNMVLDAEAVKQRLLHHRSVAHHRLISAASSQRLNQTVSPSSSVVFQQNRGASGH